MGMLIDSYIIGASNSFASAVLALGPWGYWKLDEPGSPTIALDSSGNVRNGSYVGTGTTFGAAGLFTGSSASITLNGSGRVNLPTLGAVNGVKLTLMCSVKTTATGMRQLISADDNVGANRVWQWRINANRLEFVIFLGGTTVGSIGPVINDGASHMAWLVFDPTLANIDGKIKVYVDGNLEYSSTTNLVISSTTTTKPAYGSRSSELQADAMIGSGDELAIWLGTALSGAQISGLWAARNNP